MHNDKHIYAGKRSLELIESTKPGYIYIISIWVFKFKYIIHIFILFPLQSYWSFLCFRAAIGFGQAGFTVLAPTVLGDLFFGKQITIVLAAFYFSIPVGRSGVLIMLSFYHECYANNLPFYI